MKYLCLGTKTLFNVLLKTTEYFLLKIFKWRCSSLIIFLMSGLRWLRKWPILAQALLPFCYSSSGIVFDCVSLWVFIFIWNYILQKKPFQIEKLRVTSNQTQPLRTNRKMAKSAWASMVHFLNHFNPDIRNIIRLECLLLKFLKRKYSAVFNRIG